MVFPLVPGHPDDPQRRRRVAVDARRRRRHRRAHVVDERPPGTPSPSGRCTTSATAPRCDRVGREVVPVAREAGHAEEERAGPRDAVVVGQRG